MKASEGVETPWLSESEADLSAFGPNGFEDSAGKDILASAKKKKKVMDLKTFLGVV